MRATLLQEILGPSKDLTPSPLPFGLSNNSILSAVPNKDRYGHSPLRCEMEGDGLITSESKNAELRTS
jgi:hypothetical protein